MASSHPPSTIRVVPRDRSWRVISDPGRERLIDILCTRERALEHALELASELVERGLERAVRIRVEDRSGRVEQLDVC